MPLGYVLDRWSLLLFGLFDHLLLLVELPLDLFDELALLLVTQRVKPALLAVLLSILTEVIQSHLQLIGVCHWHLLR